MNNKILELIEKYGIDEELAEIAVRFKWQPEVYHGEYRGIICGIQGLGSGQYAPLYRFPGGVSME